MNRPGRILLRIFVVLLGVLALTVLVILPAVRSQAIRALVPDASAAVSLWLQDGVLDPREVEELMAEREAIAGGGEDWLSDHLIQMSNGDWLLYFAADRYNNRKSGDVLIGHGSDGEWYYTTWHFCWGMNLLVGESQPISLRDFLDTYYLRQFTPGQERKFGKTTP